MKRIRSISPFMIIMITQLIILSFVGVMLSSVNFSFSDSKTFLNKLNDTTTEIKDIGETNKQILESGNRTSAIINELQETQRIVEESRQNQTDKLLPIFFKSFNQTERIDLLVQNLTKNHDALMEILNQSQSH